MTRLGAAPAIPAGATALAAVPGDTEMHLTLALAPRDPTGLAAFATSVSTPGTPLYGQYLTVTQFADRFGATPAAISAVRSELTAAGLTADPVTANGLSIRVSGTASEIESAFSTTLRQYRLASGRIAFANTSAPALSADVTGDVQAIVGLDSLVVPHPEDLDTRLRADPNSSQPGAEPAGTEQASGATPCPTATAAAASDTRTGIAGGPMFTGSALTTTAYTTDQFAQAYDIDSLYASGDLGQGVTVGIYELEPNFPGDITAFEKCYGLTAKVNYQKVDGGAGTASATADNGIETELDVENVIGLAPDVNVIVYQAPATGSGTTDAALDEYEAIFSADQAKVVSTSWGECEPLAGPAAGGDAVAENTLFQEAASQGESVVAAAGNSGSEDCGTTGASGAVAAVDNPASQPYVTGVGGTSLTAPGNPPTTRPTESVWNNGATMAAAMKGGAGGGGVSALWPMPSYQSSAPASLNVINSGSSATPCATTSGVCREVPDVSASADPYDAYLVYWDGSTTDGSDSAGWTGIGGTSGAAPVWASILALADADTPCVQHGSQVGFANPLLYEVAAANGSSDFNDITSGNNDLDGATLGKFPAGTGYDMASGLGSPVAANLVPGLCGVLGLSLANPGSQTSNVGVRTSLQLVATDSQPVFYSATNLPAGMTLNTSTGLIAGTPTTVGTYSVTVTARDANNGLATTSFTWSIVATSTTPPTTTTVGPGSVTTRITLSTPTRLKSEVGQRFHVGVYATSSAGEAVRYAVSGLPPGLRVSRRTGVITGVTKRPGRYTLLVTTTSPGVATVHARIFLIVLGLPHVRRYSVRGVAHGRPVIDLSLASGRYAGSLTSIQIQLPTGISAARRGGALHGLITIRTLSGQEVPFTVKRVMGEVLIKLLISVGQVQVTLAAPAVRASSALQLQAQQHPRPVVPVTLTVRETSTNVNVLQPRTRIQ